MKQLVVLVAGGTGFVGTYVVDLLKRRGHTVIVYHRGFQAVPTHADVIVNLVGIIREDHQTFQDAHVEMTKFLLRLGKKLGVQQFVQMSALGVHRGTTQYQRTKNAADGLVQRSGLQFTIVRPSMIFGSEDTSINRFRAICRTGFFPLFGNGRVQPVSVKTVSELVVAACEGRVQAHIVEVGGPDSMTYAELADHIHPGVRIVRMPRWSTRIFTGVGALWSLFPTKEQVIMLGQDNTTTDKTVQELRIKNPSLS